jgi:phosphoribosylglycinamide formyltransferase 1
MPSSHRLKNIIVFASGSGTNAQNIIRYFKNSRVGRVVLVVCNNPNAGIIERARNEGVDVLLIDRSKWKDSEWMLPELNKYEPDLLVLAGFLWLVPAYLIEAFPKKIINIHPALLPKYGGKGMYGDKVHQSVMEAGDLESGITIHYVNARYDEGETIKQATCPIEPGENAGAIAKKVHELEYAHYPKVIEELLLEQKA